MYRGAWDTVLILTIVWLVGMWIVQELEDSSGATKEDFHSDEDDI